MAGPSVCVIGAGAIGLASALALTRRGAGQVTVLEARHVAAGSSGLSVGIVETQYVTPLDIELRVRSMALFDELEREHGLRIVRNGYLRLAHTPAELADFEESVRVQRALGVHDACVLDRAAVARLVPDMAVEDLAGGLFGPSDGFLDGHLYCGLLAELAGAGGAQVLGGHELLEARPRRPAAVGACARASESSRATTSSTRPGPGPARVAGLLDVTMALSPQRHQAIVVLLGRELAYTMPSVTDYTPGTGVAGLYFRRRAPRTADRRSAHRGGPWGSLRPRRLRARRRPRVPGSRGRALRRPSPRARGGATGARLGGALPRQPRRPAAGRTRAGAGHRDHSREEPAGRASNSPR